MLKKIISFFTAAMLLAANFSINVSAETFKGNHGAGYCGAITNEDGTSNLAWSIKDNGVLTITGKGAMADYDSEDSAPWKQYIITKVVIESGVTSIGDHAFDVLDSEITSITLKDIPDSVTSIGKYAFAYCSYLESVTLPESVVSIGDSAFYHCLNLKSITLPNTVASIGNSAFYYCLRLESVNIPNGVALIDDYTFCNCKSLTSINIPNSVTSIGKSAFYNCEKLALVNIPDSVTSIGNSAFEYCESLKSVTIPESVTSIGKYAFDGCEDIQIKYAGGENISVNAGIYEDDMDISEKSTGLIFSVIAVLTIAAVLIKKIIF